MIIEIKKFGTTLTSRDSGREAYNVMQALLKNLKEGEDLSLDFNGVNTFSPSWGDEFLTPLYEKYKEKLILLNTQNPSVTATIELLSEISEISFNVK